MMKRAFLLLTAVLLISSTLVITSASADNGTTIANRVSLYNHGTGH